MFDECYLRLGRGPFASCTPLTVQLLAGSMPCRRRMSTDLRGALDRRRRRQAVERQPCRRARADLAGGQHDAAAGDARDRGSEPASIRAEALEEGSRARYHLEALRDLWAAHEVILPADFARLKHFLASEARDACSRSR
jgi:hypothetical protein